MSLCPDCTLSPSKLCTRHHAADNDCEEGDLDMLVIDLRAELAQEREESERLRRAMARVATDLMLALSGLGPK